MSEARVDERHFLTNISIDSSSVAQELGHQTVNPIRNEVSQAVCRGFMSGIVISSITPSIGMSRLALGSCVALGASVDTYISDWSKELSYDHEYAREVWEHEYNSIGEVDEYVAYASSLGVAPSKAREIAMSVTSEPAVSVPYHLAFELGLTQPLSYHRKLSHASVVAVGYFAGACLSDLTIRSLGSISTNSKDPKSMATAAFVGLLLISPVMFIRYRHVLRVPNAGRFKILGLTAYAAAIFSILAMAKTLK